MNRRSSTFGCVLTLLLVFLVLQSGLAQSQQGIPKAPPRSEGEGPFNRLIIRGATLIDGTGAPAIGPVDIVVEKNRIAQISTVGYPGVPIDTAGNSSSLNDGAAAVLVMSEEKARELGYKPIARIVSTGVAGVDPRCMGIGPVPATEHALKKAGLTIVDIGLMELNEAFAAQSLAVTRELGINPDIVNVNGEAIALGHPLGCSSARIMTSLLHEMKRRKTRYGVATMCIGVGQGIATIVESR